MTRPPASLVAAIAVLAVVTGGCGDDAGAEGGKRLDVAAAASLTGAVRDYARSFEDQEGATVAVRFAGSDELAAQIRQGVRTDVYLAADDRLPAQLSEEGELGAPEPFASNQLVVIAPADGDVNALGDVDDAGLALALGDPEVPIGRYAREAIAKLASVDAGKVLDNVRSEEPDSGSIVGKVAQGGADAGIVYATDAGAAGKDLRVIEIPGEAQPDIRYAGGVVSDSGSKDLARKFLHGLIRGDGRAALDRAGFRPPLR